MRELAFWAGGEFCTDVVGVLGAGSSSGGGYTGGKQRGGGGGGGGRVNQRHQPY